TLLRSGCGIRSVATSGDLCWTFTSYSWPPSRYTGPIGGAPSLRRHLEGLAMTPALAPLPVRVPRKITRRVMPFLFLLYITAFIDRVNVGFAGLQMTRDLGFSNEGFGFGAGI